MLPENRGVNCFDLFPEWKWKNDL